MPGAPADSCVGALAAPPAGATPCADSTITRRPATRSAVVSTQLRDCSNCSRRARCVGEKTNVDAIAFDFRDAAANTGGEFTELSAEKWAAKISKIALLLNPAEVGSAFAGTPAPDVNGSLWTIAYEFRCYILALAVVLLFGRSGWPFAPLATALSFILIFSLSTGVRWHYETGNYEPIGNVDDAVRFTLAFASGAAFQLFKHRIPCNGRIALVCLALLAIGLLWAETASIAVSIFGGYLLLYLAFAAGGSFWSELNRKNDISYGIYLYAWPIQKLGILYLPAIAPIQLTVLTIPLAAGAGLMSWHLVEKHALRWRLPDRLSSGKRRLSSEERSIDRDAALAEAPAASQSARGRGSRYA